MVACVVHRKEMATEKNDGTARNWHWENSAGGMGRRCSETCKEKVLMARSTDRANHTPGPWKPQAVRLNCFHVYLIERQTGPCLRDDYEFANDPDGNLIECRNRREAEAASESLNSSQRDLFRVAA